MTKHVTLEIDDDVMAAYERVAADRRIDVAALIAEVVRTNARMLNQDADEDEWEPSAEDLVAIRRGLEEADRGEFGVIAEFEGDRR